MSYKDTKKRRTRSYWTSKKARPQEVTDSELDQVHAETALLMKKEIARVSTSDDSLAHQLNQLSKLTTDDHFDPATLIRVLNDKYGEEIAKSYARSFVYKLHLRGYDDNQIGIALNVDSSIAHAWLREAKKEFTLYADSVTTSELVGETIAIMRDITGQALSDAQKAGQSFHAKKGLYDVARQCQTDLYNILHKAKFFERKPYTGTDSQLHTDENIGSTKNMQSLVTLALNDISDEELDAHLNAIMPVNGR